MGAKSTRQRWTYAEFARLPSEGSTRYEVIDGEVCVTPSPTGRHQEIVTRLVARLFVFADSRGLGGVFAGPLDVLFAEGDYLEPDILFIRSSRSHLVTDRGVEGPPDLVVEVLSPSTAARDRGVKLDRYRLYGVQEYWLVDPDARTVEVWGFAEGEREAVVLGAGDTLRWTPIQDAGTLEIRLSELFVME
jgi:Uma2 family endonuclease